MRGEYGFDAVVDVGKAELPPRARRIPWGFSPTSASKGTTSACAENTNRLPAGLPAGRNYLRVRGEYPRPGAGRFFYPELPPRARRIRYDRAPSNMHRGTTSACAENTKPVKTSNPNPRNYLRVRGEYAPARPLGIFSSELPPRARRIRFAPPLTPVPHGTTSACAENTFPW